MNQPDFNQHLSALLASKENKQDLIDNLNSGIAQANGDVTQLMNAWKPVVEILNKDYFVARDNTQKFNNVSPVINSLELIAQECINTFDGKTASADFMADITQLHFKCSNYYSIASTLSPDNLEKCTTWLEKAGDFINKNGLTNTRSHAIWHNLIGGHESRQYQMGLMKIHPESSVEHFREAVRIQRDVLGNKVEDPKAGELRHVLMCLGSTLVQQAMSKALVAQKEDIALLDKDLKTITTEAQGVLSQLSDEYLVLADGKPDLYRLAGTKQYTAYLYLFEGNFTEACRLIDQAAEDMEKSLPLTGAKGQLSQILNDVSKMYDAKSAATRLRSIELSKNDFEQMYADNAKRDLDNTSDNPYAHLGKIVVMLNKHRADQTYSAAATSSPVLLFKSTQQSSTQAATNDEKESVLSMSPQLKLSN